MRYILFFLFLLSLFECFSQWEITNWKNDSEIRRIWASNNNAITDGDLLITNDKGENWNTFKNSINIKNGIYSLAIDNNNIYIGSLEYFYVSNDFGKNWKEIVFDFPGWTVISSLLVLEGKVYAGTWNNGIYATTDNGISWTEKNHGLPLKIINCFALVGSNIFASVGYGNEIYLSTDQGESWTLKNNGLEQYADFNQLAVIGDKIFTTSYSDSDIRGGTKVIYMSSDMGNTWIKKNNAKSFKLNKYSFAAIEGRLFVGDSENLYYSDDFGDTWTKKSLTNEYYRSAEYLAVGDGIIYGASGTEIFISTDRGDTWTAIRNSKNYWLVNSLETRGDRLYACSVSLNNYTTFHDGLFYSSDKGDTWIRNDLDSLFVYSLLFKNNYMFACTNRGLYRSDTSIVNWKKLSEEFGYSQITTIDNKILDGGYGSYGISEDNGENWIQIKDKLPVHQFVRKFFHKDNFVIACLDSTVMISYNNDDSWEEISKGLPYDDLRIKAIEKIDDVIFLGTGFGVYTSSNMGESWQLKNNGIPLKNEKYIEVKAFAKVGKNIFVGIRFLGVFVSTDMGLNWKSINNSIFKNLEISSLTILDDYIYAGTDRGSFGDDGDAIYRAKLSDFGITDVEDIIDKQTSILYPNPAKTNVSIDFIVEPENLPNVTVELYNLTGILQSKLDYTVDYNDSNGQGTLNCNIENIPNGYYIIVIDNGKRKGAKPFIVNKE